jgi:hypothetical protein
MKIISEYAELKGKEFNSIRECAEAEASVDAKRAVALADQKVAEAYANYESVKKEVQKLLEESNAQMTKMITDATNLVKEAEKCKRDAILKYNNSSNISKKSTSERLESQLPSTWGEVINAFIAL